MDGSEFSESVLPITERLAAGLGLPVRLLHAVEPDRPNVSSYLNERHYYVHAARHRSLHARALTEPVRTRLLKAGVETNIAIPEDKPECAIVAEADKQPGTLITMASHGRSGAYRWWTGSVADRVLHHARAPILQIRSMDRRGPAISGEFDQVVVPLDRSAMAEQAIEHALHLALNLGLILQLVGAVPSVEEYNYIVDLGAETSGNSSERTAPTYEEYRTALVAETDEYLAGLAAGLRSQGARAERRVLFGPAAAAIIDHSVAEETALIVMMTHGRSGIACLVLGSVAERVVRQPGEPVLLVRAA